MKNLKWITLFMAIATMSLFTSCDKDDKDDENVEVAGTYTGTISVMAESSDAAAELTKTGENYSLALTNLNISAMGNVIEIGDVTIENVVASSNGQLSGGDKLPLEVTMPAALVAITGEKANVEVSLTSGGVSGNNLIFTLNVAVLGMPTPTPMNVAVVFSGDK